MSGSDVSQLPVVIEVAVNGATSPDRNPNVPRTSEEITDVTLRCIEAGASIIHTHISDIGVPPRRAADLYLEHYRPILEARPDAILYPTIVFGVAVEDRVAHLPMLAEECGLRMGICDPGSLNLSGSDEDGIPAPVEFVYTNSPHDTQHMFAICDQYRLGPGISIFEPGFLRYTLAYRAAGRLPRGANVRLYLGGESSYRGDGHVDLLFGLPPRPSSIDIYREMMAGTDLVWSVAVLSGDVFANGVARHALECGGHLRVGLEDFAGSRQPNNEELVQQAVELVKEVGRPLATPAEAAKILDLPR
ncbi:3-keto-5-aminohexanoate cleavage protein [Myxococcota bacterium]|nr:3-keto-5-aminohexanoate cleavage protein [Myxococcota bacterium]